MSTSTTSQPPPTPEMKEGEVSEEKKYDGFTTKIYSNGCGLILFTRPKKLNAFTYYMLKAFFAILYRWRDDKRVLFVVFASSSKKSFSAGGDMIELADPIYDKTLGYTEYQFIGSEYRMDLLIATYNKPVISLINGIVMGGGAGVGINAHYSVVTQGVRFAMPEINVFYFGDCLVNYYLATLSYNFGKYLLLTGYILNDYEMLNLKLGQFFCDENEVYTLLYELTMNEFDGVNDRSVKSNIEKLLFGYHNSGLRGYDTAMWNEKKQLFEAKVQCVQTCFACDTLYEIDGNLGKFIDNCNNENQKELAIDIKQKLNNVSPLSALVQIKLLERSKMGSIYDNALDNYTLTCKLLTDDNYGRGTREWMTGNMRKKKNVKRRFPYDMTVETSQYITNDIIDLYFDLPANYTFGLEFNSEKKVWNVIDLVKDPLKPSQLPIDDVKHFGKFLKPKL